jgi:cephalosporin hydroxylase
MENHGDGSPTQVSSPLTVSSKPAANGVELVNRSRVDKNPVLRILAGLYEQRPTPSGLGRRLASGILAPFLYQETGSEADEYHKWYYNTHVWMKTTWMGIDTWKSVSDMWNYQEILVDLKPALVIEFGTNQGGSALYFANVMRQIGAPFKVLSVDINHLPLNPTARLDPDVMFVESRSTVPAIAEQINLLKREYPGKIFVILDSDHSKEHVLAEMKLLRPLLSAGDYLVVEDSMLNGHPNLPGWGPGPFEAIEAYEEEFPDDYTHDIEREQKFGFTFSPNGFLIRN